MKISLTDLVQTLAPEPVIIEIGGSSFVVNELTVGQVLRLDGFDKLADDQQAIEAMQFVASLFKGQPPPEIGELKASIESGDDVAFQDRQFMSNKVGLIIGAIQVACSEVAGPKKLMAAVETVRQRLSDQTDSGS